MEISFKTCTLADLDTLINVGTEAYIKSYPYIWKGGDTSFYVNNSFSKQVLEADLSDTALQYYLIYADGVACGLIKIRLHSAVDGYNKTEALELEKIYLLQEYAGKGIGKQAVDFIAQLSKQKGKKILWLAVMDTAKALAFYQKLGFTTVSRFQLPYPGLIDSHRGMQRMIIAV